MDMPIGNWGNTPSPLAGGAGGEGRDEESTAYPLYVLLLRNMKNNDEAVEFVGKGARGG